MPNRPPLDHLRATRAPWPRLLAGAVALGLALPASLGPDGPALGFAPPAVAEEESSAPLALGVVIGGERGKAVADVRVNDPYRPGELALCHLQSEATVAAHQQNVYVAYNDTRNCNDGLGMPGVRRSENGFARSTDGGVTFDDIGPLLSAQGEIEHLDGDPTLAVDTRGEDSGTVYYSSLSGSSVGSTVANAYRGVAVGVSRDGGQTFEWHDASGVDRNRDKPWIAVDNSGGPYDGNVYVTWAHTATGARAIKLARSEDAGRTWSAPLTLEGGPDWTNGARPVVGPDGAVHVVWLHSAAVITLHYTRSIDGGRTFAPPEAIAQFAGISDTGECPGYLAVEGKIRVNELPSIAVDAFGSADPEAPDHNPEWGRVYVAWPAKGTASDDAADAWLTSRDPHSGAWTAKLRLNRDSTTRDQLFPEVVVPGPSRVTASWVDRREDPQNLAMRQYAAESADGGRTFGADAAVSDVAFPPPFTFPNSDPFIAPCYAGDYNGLFAAENGSVYAAWSDNRDDLLVNGPAGQRHIPDPNVYVRRW